MLEKILILLGLDSPTQAMTDRIETIIGMTEQRLAFLLGIPVNGIPTELSYIVVEVSIARFNRIGSEGVSSHTVQGESLSWTDDDFKPYMDDIQEWLNAQDDVNTTRGRVRFI